MLDPTDQIAPGLARAADGVNRPDQDRDARLRASAVRFEAAFLAEMLRHAGLGKMPSAFNGGAGEAGFSGTLIQEYATRISEAGGIGIADGIYRSLAERSGE